MVEPGFGPHVHFIKLKAGFYLISSKGRYKGNEVSGDTIIEILSSQPVSSDFNLQVK